jgi:hypothetical protein
MKYAHLFLSLGLLLTACSRQDAKLLGKQVAGSWTSSNSHTTAIYDPDGSFLITTRSDTSNSLAGTWQIKDRLLITTVTNAPDMFRALVGEVMQYNITHLDGHQLEFEDVKTHATFKYSR